MTGDVQVPHGDRDVETVAAVLKSWGVRSRHSEWTDRQTQVNAAQDVLAALASQPAQSGDGVAEAQRVKVRASALTGRVYALTEYAEDPETGLIVADVKHDVTDDVALIVAEAVAQERERIAAAIERLAELRKDYLPGLTGAQMPHVDLIQFEIDTVRGVLRILQTGDARGWAHSFRWDDLEGLDVLARATTEEADHG